MGIGTASPSAKLEVNGGGTATTGGTLVVRQDGDTNSDGIALTSSNATSHRFWKDSGGKQMLALAIYHQHWCKT